MKQPQRATHGRRQGERENDKKVLCVTGGLYLAIILVIVVVSVVAS